MTMFTEEQVTETIRAVVADKGEDYIIDDICRYGTYDDNGYAAEPVCIVGHVLYRLDPELFARVVETENSTQVLALDESPFPLKVGQALYEAQFAQDNYESWGKALSEYEARLTWESSDE